MNENRPGSEKCLLCGSSDLQVVYADPKARMVTSDCRAWPYAASVVVCVACSHLQKRVNDELNRQTAAVYSQYSLYDLSDGGEQQLFGGPGQDGPKTRSGQILERLQRAVGLPASGTMLDVGCGNGAMVEAFGKSFPAWKLFGYEQNSKYRKRVMDLPGVMGFYEERLERVDREFDLITAIHVLEHVKKPEPFLVALQNLITPQGVLVIEVPDAASNPFDMIVVDHYSHFSSNVLSSLVRGLGYEVLVCATDWVAKEITLVLRRGAPTRQGSDSNTAMPDLLKRYHQHAEWLRHVIEVAAGHATSSRLGVFGTAIAGTWLGAVLGDGVRFFVDEDMMRVGKTHLGKPVVHPSQLTPADRVFLAFPYPIAERLHDRLSSMSSAQFLLPPLV